MQSSSETDESESSEDGEDLTSSGVCLSKIKYYSNICNNEWNIVHENCHSDEVSFKMSEFKCFEIIIVVAEGGSVATSNDETTLNNNISLSIRFIIHVQLKH